MRYYDRRFFGSSFGFLVEILMGRLALIVGEKGANGLLLGTNQMQGWNKGESILVPQVTGIKKCLESEW